MKKYLSVALMALLTLAFSACGGDDVELSNTFALDGGNIQITHVCDRGVYATHRFDENEESVFSFEADGYFVWVLLSPDAHSLRHVCIEEYVGNGSFREIKLNPTEEIIPVLKIDEKHEKLRIQFEGDFVDEKETPRTFSLAYSGGYVKVD